MKKMKEFTDENYTKRALNILNNAAKLDFLITEEYRGLDFEEVVDLAETVLINKEPVDTTVSLKVKKTEDGRHLFEYDGDVVEATAIETDGDGKKYACGYYVDDRAIVAKLISDAPVE